MCVCACVCQAELHGRNLTFHLVVIRPMLSRIYESQPLSNGGKRTSRSGYRTVRKDSEVDEMLFGITKPGDTNKSEVTREVEVRSFALA